MAVPAGSSVTIANLSEGRYEVSAITKWDTIYSTNVAILEESITEGVSHVLTFTYSFNGKKYIYGYSHSTKTVREG